MNKVKIALAVTLFLTGLMLPLGSVSAQDEQVMLVLNAPTGALAVGDTLTVRLQAYTNAQAVDGIEFHLNFDPAQLEVRSITTTAQMPLHLIPAAFDNTVGTIDFAGGTLTLPPSGIFNVATITLAAKTALTAPDIAFAPRELPRLTDVTFAGASVLGSTHVLQHPAEPAPGALVVILPNDDFSIREGSAGSHVLVYPLTRTTHELVVTLTTTSQCTAPPALFFAAGDRTPQSIPLTAVDDQDTEGDHGCPLTLTAISGDPAYDALVAPTVLVRIQDNDNG